MFWAKAEYTFINYSLKVSKLEHVNWNEPANVHRLTSGRCLVAFRSHLIFLRMHFSIFTPPFPDNAVKMKSLKVANKSFAYSDTLFKVSLVFFKLVIFIDGINGVYCRLFCHLVRLCFCEASVRKHKETTTCLFFFSILSLPLPSEHVSRFFPHL